MRCTRPPSGLALVRASAVLPPDSHNDTHSCREDARFLWKRTPEAVRQGSPELAAAFALLQRLWMRDYQHVWAALQVGCGHACPACALPLYQILCPLTC